MGRLDKKVGILEVYRGVVFMKLNLVVRQAVQEDIPALTNLLKDLFALESDFSFDESKQRSGLKLMLEERNSRCIMVAEVDSQVIGMCSAQMLISTSEGGAAAIIEDVVVNESFQGRGVGRHLLAKIEDWAFCKGVKRLALLADLNNIEALNFYEKMNWRKTQLICFHKKK